MAKDLADGTQNTIYPDKSIKHRVQARSLRMISLGLDEWSNISFMAMERRFKPPVRDSVKVDMYRETDNPDGTVEREQVVKDCIDVEDSSIVYPVEWDDTMNTGAEAGSFARWPIDASYVQDPCVLEVVWKWKQTERRKSDRHWSMFYEARQYMELYSSLTPSEKDLCVAVLNRFWGLFDNHYGNSAPNLAEEVQTSFGYENVARAMQIAVAKINTTAIQKTSYGIGDYRGQHFSEEWYNLLMTGTLIEIIREFIFGYIEQPNIMGQPGVVYADRRDYVNRWKDAKNDLESDFKAMMQTYSRYHLNLGGSSVLVAGGLFGGGGSGSALVKNSWTTAVQKGWNINLYQPASVMPIDPNS